jgi:hypothetical protein
MATCSRSDDRLFRLPLGFHAGGLFLEVRDLGSHLSEVFRAGGVLLPRESALLDGQLYYSSLNAIEVHRHGVDLHPDPRGRLVHEIDGLVRQEAPGDVAMREDGCRHDCAVVDAHAVVHLVPFLEAPKDRDRILDAGLAHEHGLKTPLEGLVLLDVLAVLVESGGPDAAKLATCKCGLEHVRGVLRTLGLAGPNDRVDLVDEEDDLSARLGHGLQDRLEPLLELPPELGTGHQRTHVQRKHPLVLQTFGDVPLHDAAGHAFRDGRFPHARLPDENRVVLRAPGKDLHDATDLLIPADHRVEFARPREVREVDREPLEGHVLLFRVRIVRSLGAPNTLESVEKAVPVEPAFPKRRGCAPPALEKGHEDVLGTDVLVLHRFRLAESLVKEPTQLCGQVDLLAGRLGKPVNDFLQTGTEPIQGHAAFAEQGSCGAAVLVEQREGKVSRSEFGIANAPGDLVRPFDCLARLHGESVEVHSDLLYCAGIVKRKVHATLACRV